MTKVSIITKRKNIACFRFSVSGDDRKSALSFSLVYPAGWWSHLWPACVFWGLFSLAKSLEQAKKSTIIIIVIFVPRFSQVSLQPRLTDEELYELSLAREPRMHSHSVRKIVMQCSFRFMTIILVFTLDKKQLMICYFDVGSCLKSWLKCFNPTPSRRVILQ